VLISSAEKVKIIVNDKQQAFYNV